MKISSVLYSFGKRNLFCNHKSKSDSVNFVDFGNYEQFCNYQAILNKGLINFKGGSDNFSQELEGVLDNNNEDDFFLFIDSKFRKRAKDKKIYASILDDVVQNAIMEVLLLFQAFNNGEISKNELLTKIQDIYSNIKAKDADYVTSCKTISIYKQTLGGDSTIQDTISDDERFKIRYLKEASEEQKEKAGNDLKKALQGVHLTKRERDMLQSRFNDHGKVTYSDIARQQGVSDSLALLIVRRAIKKIQLANHSLPKKHTDNVDKLVKKFEKEGLTNEECMQAYLREPALFDVPPDTIEKNVRGVVKKFTKEGLTIQRYLNVCLREPVLFNKSADFIEKKIKALVAKFEKEGLSTKDYLDACMIQPVLLSLAPDTIEDNVRDLVDIFQNDGLTVKSYLNSCLKQATLFAHSPKTVAKNVTGLVKKFENEGLTVKNYLKACLAEPRLFTQSPDAIEDKVKGTVKKFKNEGLTVKMYLMACLRHPGLFNKTPEITEAKVRGLVTKFENEGLTVEKYLPACLRHPQLFTMLPDTIEGNVRDLVKKFEKEGLTVEKYLIACIRQSSLFCQCPDTIEANVRDLVKEFKKDGLTVEKYLPACIRKASLFYQSPNTISGHFRALKFINKNLHKELSESEIVEKILKESVSLACTNIRNYSYLLRRKMFTGFFPKELRGSSKLNMRISDYLKNNPSLSFRFSIINDEMSNEFIEYASNLAYEATGRRDVFDVTIE